MDSYLTELARDHPESQFVLAGDFNARMGPNDNFLEIKFNLRLNDLEQQPIGLPFTRSAKDCKVNFAGLCLTNLLCRWEFHILNGAFLGRLCG